MTQTIKIRICKFTEGEREKWDEYVKKSPYGTFFHLSGWKDVLEKTYSYKPNYLYTEAEGKICGVLPLFLIKNLLSGKALISLPFGIYGGVCADNDYVAEQLINEAKDITRRKNAGYLELRNLSNHKSDMPTKSLYATFVKELPKSVEECLKNLPRKARAAARKGINSGLKVEVGAHLLNKFYDIYSISVRNLGSPVFPYAYLTNLVNEFKGNVHILIVKHEDKPIAGVFSFLYKDTVMPYYGGALHEFFKYQPNNFMYFKLMEWGVENGYKFFDFGRSKQGAGSFKFKELQGFEAQPLHYQYYLNTIKEIPDTSSLSPKVQFVSSMWKKMPVWATKLIGPKIIGLTPP